MAPPACTQSPQQVSSFTVNKMQNEYEWKQGEQNVLPVVRELFAKAGSEIDPERMDIHDLLKAIETIKLEAERDVAIFAGALDLLQSQYERCLLGIECAVCNKLFESKCGCEVALEQICIKIQETESARDECEVVEMHEASSSALSQIFENLGGQKNVNPTQALQVCHSRVAFNMRSGSLTELRNQKAESLNDGKCFACMRQFLGNELCNYLTKVDREAVRLEQSLHIHQG